MSSNVPEESLQLKRVGLISFLITELHLLRVCNPLARSAGVFNSLSGAFKTFQKPSKTLGTGPYTVRDARVRFSGRPQCSNVADFLKKYTSASRKRVTHTEQLKLRDKDKK